VASKRLVKIPVIDTTSTQKFQVGGLWPIAHLLSFLKLHDFTFVHMRALAKESRTVPITDEQFHKKALRKFIDKLAASFEASQQVERAPEIRKKFFRLVAEYLRTNQDVGWNDYKYAHDGLRNAP
jgi:hypothetical protein